MPWPLYTGSGCGTLQRNDPGSMQAGSHVEPGTAGYAAWTFVKSGDKTVAVDPPTHFIAYHLESFSEEKHKSSIFPNLPHIFVIQSVQSPTFSQKLQPFPWPRPCKEASGGRGFVLGGAGRGGAGLCLTAALLAVPLGCGCPALRGAEG